MSEEEKRSLSSKKLGRPAVYTDEERGRKILESQKKYRESKRGGAPGRPRLTDEERIERRKESKRKHAAKKRAQEAKKLELLS